MNVSLSRAFKRNPLLCHGFLTASCYATYRWKITRNISSSSIEIRTSSRVFRTIKFKYPSRKYHSNARYLLELTCNNIDLHIIWFRINIDISFYFCSKHLLYYKTSLVKLKIEKLASASLLKSKRISYPRHCTLFRSFTCVTTSDREETKTNQAGRSCDMLQSQWRWPLFSLFARSDCPSMTPRRNAKGRLCPQVPFSKLPHQNAFLYSFNRGVCVYIHPPTFFSFICVCLTQYVYFASFEYFVEKKVCAKARIYVNYSWFLMEVKMRNIIEINYKFYF